MQETTTKATATQVLANEKKLGEKRIQASNICIQIYLDLHKDDMVYQTTSVQRAWFVGRDIYKLVSEE